MRCDIEAEKAAPPCDALSRHLVAERGLADRIEAPGSRAGEDEIQKDEAVNHRFIAAVEQWHKTFMKMANEIGRCHFAGKDESSRPGEQADQQQKAADQLEQAGNAIER